MSNRKKMRKYPADWRAGLRPVVVRLRGGQLKEVDLASFDLRGHPWFCATCGEVSTTSADACHHAAMQGAPGYCVERVAAAAALHRPGTVLNS
jgi:hypothetical protein